jgi:hypothetical protein
MNRIVELVGLMAVARGIGPKYTQSPLVPVRAKCAGFISPIAMNTLDIRCIGVPWELSGHYHDEISSIQAAVTHGSPSKLLYGPATKAQHSSACAFGGGCQL